MSAIEVEGFVARALLFVFGTALLFPWNASITAVDYFSLLFEGKHVDRVFSVVYLTANLGSIYIVVQHAHKVTGKRRVQLGFGSYVVLMTAIPICDFAQVRNERGTGTYLWIAAVVVALLGVADALCQPALYGQAALLPAEHTQALVSGTAASGVIITLLRLATKAGGGESFSSVRSAAMLYFMLAAAYVAAALLLYTHLFCRLPLVSHYAGKVSHPGCHESRLSDPYHAASLALNDTPTHQGLTSAETSREGACLELHTSAACPRRQDRSPAGVRPTVTTCADIGASPTHTLAVVPKPTSLEHFPQEAEVELHLLQNCKPSHEALSPDEERQEAALAPADVVQLIEPCLAPDCGESWLASRVWSALPECIAALGWMRVLRLIAVPAASVFLLYFVTLMIFPGFLSEDVQSASLGSWFPLLLFLTYNVCDCVSRSLQAPHKWLLHLSLSRLMFLPLFAMCSYRWIPAWGIFLLTAAFGVTNGSLTTTAFVAASSVAGPHAEMAGNVMVLSLMNGLWMGSWASWLWLLK